MEETAFTAVTNVPKIVPQAGAKRIRQIISTERIPPALIFLRFDFKEHILKNGPSGALGFANVSGWITEYCF